MRPLRTVIIEDEPLARDLLRSYIALHEDVELVGEAENGSAGIAIINTLRPDLVLIDIHMPEVSGITLVQELTYEPAIVFVTAFDMHAVAEFELGAFDYLLKPVTAERFATALSRVRERFDSGVSTPPEIGTSMRLNAATQGGFLEHFFVRKSGALILVKAVDVVRLEADDDYTAIFANGQRHLVHVALRDMVDRLDPARFIRVHRSHVLNVAHVQSSVLVDRRLHITMRDGSVIEASRAGTVLLRSRAL